MGIKGSVFMPAGGTPQESLEDSDSDEWLDIQEFFAWSHFALVYSKEDFSDFLRFPLAPQRVLHPVWDY